MLHLSMLGWQQGGLVLHSKLVPASSIRQFAIAGDQLRQRCSADGWPIAGIWRVMQLLLLLLACTGTANARADQFISWQGFEIHYTTFSSRLIPPAVAAVHQIPRADNRLVTNISVRRDGQPVAAKLQGTVTNLLNQQSIMEFTEVLEADAIYYLANQLVDERDTLRYSISIVPAGAADRTEDEYKLVFSRDFYQ